MSQLIAFSDVSVAYPGTLALDSVSFRVDEGDVLAVVGANGSGKTTLLSTLTGVRKPTHGRLTTPEGETSFRGPRQALAQGIALVPQEPQLADTLSAWENVVIGTRPMLSTAGGPSVRRRAAERIRQAAPHIDPDGTVSDLRKADRAIIGLLRALARSPKVLALDEPTAVLGENGVQLVETATREMRRRGGAVVLVSHRLKDIVRLATRVLVLVDGRLMHDSPVSDVSLPDLLDTLAAGRAAKVDRPTAPRRARPSGAGPGPVLQIVEHDTGGLRIENLTVGAGEIVGVAGMAGSGRSRLCRLAAGLSGSPSSVRYRNHPLPSTAQRCRRDGIAFVPEDRVRDALFGSLTVGRNLEVGDLARGRLGRWTGASPDSARIGKLMADFGVKAPSSSALITSLSGGNQQRTVIARELSSDPALLVADEPTQGVDAAGRTGIHAIIKEFVTAGGAALIVSSEFEELQELADRIVVMRDGELVAEVPPSVDYRRLVEIATDAEEIS